MERRIEPAQLRDRIGQAAVSLRGWDYPHIDRDIRNVDGAIECQTNYRTHIERWRFHRSGLFFHRFRMWEDLEPAWTGQDLVSSLGSLWHLTEVWEFGSRLYAQDESVREVNVTLRISGLTGRQLTTGNDEGFVGRIGPHDPIDVYDDSVTVTRLRLAEHSRALARQMSADFFFRLGAEDVTADRLVEPQQRLFDLRIGRG